MYALDNKVAVVTGGASGIGQAVAKRLAAEGCRVAIFDVDSQEAEATCNNIEATGARCVAYTVDVSQPAQVEAAMRAVEADFGRIDILVNNAGVLRVGLVTELSERDWELTFQVNLGGAVRCCKAVVPRMIERKSGRIINTASWFGKTGKPHFSAYCASKFAVIGFTQSLAMEVAEHGITVNAVCPGTIVETRMRRVADAAAVRLKAPTALEREHTIPLGRAGRPDDVARVVAFLASAEASYMTGQAVNVTGGLWLS